MKIVKFVMQILVNYVLNNRLKNYTFFLVMIMEAYIYYNNTTTMISNNLSYYSLDRTQLFDTGTQFLIILTIL